MSGRFVLSSENLNSMSNGYDKSCGSRTCNRAWDATRGLKLEVVTLRGDGGG